MDLRDKFPWVSADEVPVCAGTLKDVPCKFFLEAMGRAEPDLPCSDCHGHHHTHRSYYQPGDYQFPESEGDEEGVKLDPGSDLAQELEGIRPEVREYIRQGLALARQHLDRGDFMMASAILNMAGEILRGVAATQAERKIDGVIQKRKEFYGGNSPVFGIKLG